jgi:hypothetical protein
LPANIPERKKLAKVAGTFDQFILKFLKVLLIQVSWGLIIKAQAQGEYL